MVILVTGKRRVPAFYRVSDKGGGSIMIDSVKCGAERFDSVPTQIAHQLGQLLI